MQERVQRAKRRSRRRSRVGLRRRARKNQRLFWLRVQWCSLKEMNSAHPGKKSRWV